MKSCAGRVNYGDWHTSACSHPAKFIVVNRGGAFNYCGIHVRKYRDNPRMTVTPIEPAP